MEVGMTENDELLKNYSKSDRRKLIKMAEKLREIKPVNKENEKDEKDVFQIVSEIDTEKHQKRGKSASNNKAFPFVFGGGLFLILMFIGLFFLNENTTCIFILLVIYIASITLIPVVKRRFKKEFRYLSESIVENPYNNGSDSIYIETGSFGVMGFVYFAVAFSMTVTLYSSSLPKDVTNTIIAAINTLSLLLLVTAVDPILETWIKGKRKNVKESEIKDNINYAKMLGIYLIVMYWLLSIVIMYMNGKIDEKYRAIDDDKTYIRYTNQKHNTVNTDTSVITLKNGKAYRLMNSDEVSISKDDLKSLKTKGNKIYHIENETDKGIKIKLDNNKTYKLEQVK